MTGTPKLQGLAKRLAMFEHNMEDGAGKLITKIDAVEARGLAALAKSDVKINAKATLVGEIEQYVTALEGANGGDPLDDSSDTSGASAPPAAVGASVASPAETVAVAPEKLTVHGVSAT